MSPQREILAQRLIFIYQTDHFACKGLNEFLSLTVPEQGVHQVLCQFGL